ncbi:MAG: hypothetical protein HDT28_00810 [Clostridiales bacterium]|nr:hypothetical protein [Clostridiales bacterium]
MAYLKVLNVGQGDCMVIRPLECKHRAKMYFVDLGPGHIDVTKEIDQNDDVNIILTHHHADHINGIKYFFNKLNQISNLFVPYDFNEIGLIARALLNLKGMQGARGCGEYISELNQVVDSQLFLKSVLDFVNSPGSDTHINLRFVAEGDRLCNHIMFLNPALAQADLDFCNEISMSDCKDMFFSLFKEDFADKLTNYVESVRHGHGVDHRFSAMFLHESGQPFNESDYSRHVERTQYACGTLLKFISGNYKQLETFTGHPSRSTFRAVHEKYVDRAHDSCVVLKAKHKGCQYLLAGDASKRVFRRLTRSNIDISADYLKVSHHGSKNNTSRPILSKINPKYAIISHDNRTFGNMKDPHPNMDVLKMLDEYNVITYMTNDSMKNGKEYKRSMHICDDFLEI